MQPLRIQPIPYQGSKRLLAPRICKLFPRAVHTLYEPFAGSAAITLYAAHHGLAKNFIIGDILPELIELWELIISHPLEAASRYKNIWSEQFHTEENHFNIIRSDYNKSRDPISLLYLIARCVKNAVRFNKEGSFTQSVDKRRKGVHPDKLEAAVCFASKLLKGRTTLYTGDYVNCISSAKSKDLVYLDPPYQGTTYGRDKRYAAQLEREHLVDALMLLNSKNIPFILSYDGRTGDKVYAEKLPEELEAKHIPIHAGRSSQATLSGREEETIESLYISKGLSDKMQLLPDFSAPSKQSGVLLLFP